MLMFKALFFTLMGFLFLSCGGGSKGKNNSGREYGPVEGAIVSAASENDLPYRLVLAVGLMESQLSSDRSYTSYGDKLQLGVESAETAFGIGYKKLGLTKSKEKNDLGTQVNAYAKWLRAKIDEKSLSLDSSIPSNDSLYDWIWVIAQIHRSGDVHTKNVQIIFALELLDILNTGMTWQDSKTDEMIVLKANPEVITSELFSSQIQQNLKLDLQKSEIFSVDYLQTSYEPIVDLGSKPERIQVVHCPFSLSNCLALQSESPRNSDVSMQAHYIIPSDASLLPNPVKIRPHRSSVWFSNAKGKRVQLKNKVVIMLVGNSGRFVNGKRVKAKPDWFTNNQLISLGKIIQGACQLMKAENPAVDVKRCKNPDDGKQGPVFLHQSTGDQYGWGDIPDYDESIFWNYVKKPDQTDGAVEFSFFNDTDIFDAGSAMPFDLKMINGSSKVVVELMERCKNGKLIWTTLETRFIRDSTIEGFDFTLYGEGPNNNGQQFLRALVFNLENQLISWAVDDLFLVGYEKGSNLTANLKQCERLGT